MTSFNYETVSPPMSHVCSSTCERRPINQSDQCDPVNRRYRTQEAGSAAVRFICVKHIQSETGIDPLRSIGLMNRAVLHSTTAI